VERMVQARRMAVLIKMGLGKTIITLTALADMDLLKVLVVAPAAVVERDVWGREARGWEHTKHLNPVPVVGTAKQREHLLGTSAFHCVSYENAIWLSDVLDLNHYQAIIFDELSKMKHAGTARFRRLRVRGEEVPVRFGLTGSPVGNHLLDIWGEMFMVAGAAPLGPRFVDFRQQYFKPSGYGRFQSWTLAHPACEAEIHERLKPHAFSLDAQLAADKLPALHTTPIFLPLPKEVREIEAKLASTCTAELAKGVTLEALSASAFAGKARQLASGAVYVNAADESSRFQEVHSLKIDALREILDEQQGEPVLCFFWYQHELARLLRAFPDARLATDQKALDAWDRREVPLMLAHPQSAGHGLNLQKGGSTVVWFAVPWSHELWEQGNGRLVRVGQSAPEVSALALLVGETERALWDALTQKGAVQARLTDATVLDRDDRCHIYDVCGGCCKKCQRVM
jgi:hypothetical protein